MCDKRRLFRLSLVREETNLLPTVKAHVYPPH